MGLDFEELDYRSTPLGELSLRRRRVLSLEGREVFEVKLGDEFLMSSLFHEGEIALATLGLAELGKSRLPGAVDHAAQLDVVVGGLGLGYTAAAALDYPGVRCVLVIEALAEVIRWHRQRLVPLGEKLAGDARCRLVSGDFFALAQTAGQGFDHDAPGRRFHAVLLDVDHSPRNLLHSRHGSFYQPAGLRSLTNYLQPGGVFALWSNDPPDEEFLQALASTFAASRAHVVKFHNPLQNREAANTVYVART